MIERTHTAANVLSRRNFIAACIAAITLPIGSITAQVGKDDAADEDDVSGDELNTLSREVADISPQSLEGPEGPFTAYVYLQTRIRQQKLSSNDRIAIEKAIHLPRQQAKMLETFNSLVTSNDPSITSGLYEKLNLQLTRAAVSPDILYGYLKKTLPAVVQTAEARPTRSALIYAWPWADGANAAIHAFEATGQARFLTLVSDGFERIINTLDSKTKKVDESRKRILQSWGFSHRGRWVGVVTHAGRIGFPIARFCWAVRQNKDLDPDFRKLAARYQSTIEAALAEFNDDFWMIKGGDQGYYKRHALDDVEPLNHMHAVAETQLMLHKLTEDDAYRRRAKCIAQYFLSCIERQKNGTYTWGYQPTPRQKLGHPPEPIWKGEVTISFPVLAHREGYFFGKNHMRGFARTFSRNIYRGDNQFNQNIGDGELDPLVPFEGGGDRVTGLLGWMQLDFMDRRIRTILENAVASRFDIFRGGWFTNTKCAEMCAYRMKSEGIDDE